MTKIISIDGNIGSGKSTFIEKLKYYYSNTKNCNGKKICFLQEPVSIWNTIKDSDGKTILECFYGDPEKYSFAFQMMAYISRLSLIKEALEKSYDVIITERSVYTDKNIFAKMLFDSNKINPIEYQIYNKWHQEFLKDLPKFNYLYLQTDPDIAYKRILKRARPGEDVSLEYIKKCHQYHEKWFEEMENKLIINANMDNSSDSYLSSEWIERIEGMMDNMTINFDGSSRGNPGLCGAGFIIYQNNKSLYEGKKFLSDNNTNNFAEYSALILSLEVCLSKNIKDIIIKGDSNLVIKQIKGEYLVKSELLLPLYNKAMKLLYNFNSYQLIHIRREKNGRADKLANEAVDEYLKNKSKKTFSSLEML